MAKKKETKQPDLAPRSVGEYAEDRRNKSSSKRFTSTERWVNPDPWDGDLIIEHRGEPDKKTEPAA
jgi:hypothetical protein